MAIKPVEKEGRNTNFSFIDICFAKTTIAKSIEWNP